jgi:hypothetical protein
MIASIHLNRAKPANLRRLATWMRIRHQRLSIADTIRIVAWRMAYKLDLCPIQRTKPKRRHFSRI